MEFCDTNQTHMKTKGNKRLQVIDSLLGDFNRIQDHEFTSDDYLHRCIEKGMQIKSRTAYDRLQEMVKNGILKYRVVAINGKSRKVYSENES